MLQPNGRRRHAWLFLALVACAASPARGDLEFVPDTAPQALFGGQPRPIACVWHNPGADTAEVRLTTRVYQTSSWTAVRVHEAVWKELRVLPGQTVLESALLEFPAVKAETRFLVQWLGETHRVLGQSDVLVFPTNLLQDLKPLAGNEPIGAFEPNSHLKPLLKGLGLDFLDLEVAGVSRFSGKLAIFGPFESRGQIREGLRHQIRTLAKRNIGVVWIEPPRQQHDPPQPSFYSVPGRQTAVVIVQPELVANLAEAPQSQLNLLYFCRLACHPEPPCLPEFAAQP
jgi:hypothetical protein